MAHPEMPLGSLRVEQSFCFVHDMGSSLLPSHGPELRARVCSYCAAARLQAGLARAEIQPGHQTWTEARNSGCYPGVMFCVPLREGQGQRSVSPTGRGLGGRGWRGSTIQVHSYLTGE